MYKIFHFVVDRSHTGLQLTLKSLPTLKCKYLYLLVTSPFSMNVCSFVFKTLHSLFCERRMDTKPLMARYEDLTGMIEGILQDIIRLPNLIVTLH